MKKIFKPLFVLFVFLSFLVFSCKKKEATTTLPGKITLKDVNSLTPFDSTLIASFYKEYPALQKYQAETAELYQKRNYQYVWFDTKGILEVSHLLNNKLNSIADEGIKTTIPYKEKLDALFKNATEKKPATINDELLITSLYFFTPIKFSKD